MALTQASIHFSLESFSWKTRPGFLTTHLQLLPSFKNEWSCTCAPPICLNDVDREYLILEDSNST